jgi:hypothetical protein
MAKRPSGENDVLHFGDCVDAVLDNLCMLMKCAIEHELDTSNVVHRPLLVPQADDLHSCRRIFRSASIKKKRKKFTPQDGVTHFRDISKGDKVPNCDGRLLVGHVELL